MSNAHTRNLKLFSTPSGDLFEVVRRGDGQVYFHTQGGGFEFALNEKTFHEEFQPAALTWKQVRVTGDWCDPGESYPAWWDGRRWNGWIKPYFDPATAAAMAESAAFSNLYRHGSEWRAIQDEGVEIFPMECIEVQPDRYFVVCGIGAGSWCWELAGDES